MHCGNSVLNGDIEITKQKIELNNDKSFSITVQIEDVVHLNILNNKEHWFKYDKTTTIRDLVTSLTLDLFKGIEITNFEQFKK